MVWTVACILIYTFVSGGMDRCMYVNMYIGTNVTGGMDGCMHVNMYTGIWWYGPLYVFNMYIDIWLYGLLYVC